MKTFIWCDDEFFEHEILIVLADVIEEARIKMFKKIREFYKQEIINAKNQFLRYDKKDWTIEDIKWKKHISTYPLRVRNSWIEKIKTTDPIILEFSKAIILRHSNW